MNPLICLSRVGAALVFITVSVSCQGSRASRSAAPAAQVTTGSEVSATGEPSATQPAPPNDLVAQGYKLLAKSLVLPVRPADLLSAAWSGATAEAKRQGLSSLPPQLILGDDSTTNIASYQASFGSLLATGKGKLDEGKLDRAALTSMAESVDDCHTAYLTRDQWDSLNADLQGQESIDTLPLTFQLQSPYLIESVVFGGDADRQGIKPGDRIAAFDGLSLDDVPLSQRKFLSAGSAGTDARLDLQSPNGQKRTVTVKREVVDRPVLTARMIGSVGYIRLRTFVFNLNRVLDPSLGSLQDQGARAFVIDLRGNLGGELNSDIHLLSKFIPPGLIATSTARNGRVDQSRADGGLLPGPPPLAVLVDGGSLSASELFAAAIEQFHAGEVVGTPTPGCLLGSTFRSLSEGSSMQITVVKVTVGPQQIVVNNVGVVPDITVPIQAGDFAAGRDPQLDRAVADLQAQLGP